MALTPPTGTLWALLAAPEESDGQPAAVEEKQPSPTPPPPPRPPPVATEEKASNSHMKTKGEKGTATSKTLKLSGFERKALKERILLVQEAVNNGKFSALSQKAEPDKLNSIQKLKAESSPQKISIWGVPLLEDNRTDAILLKFLKAKNFDVEESFTMLKNTIHWSREFDVDGLVDQLDGGDDLLKVAYVHGCDKEGRPVWYNAYGEFRDKEMYVNTFADEDKRMNFVRRMIGILERNIRKLDFGPGGICTFVLVVDLKNSPGLGKKELRIACDQLHRLLQDNYPEFVEKQVFINVPTWYLAFYSLLRPFLTDYTRSKFIFAGPSKAADTLFNYISPENLPVQYGGLNTTYPHIRTTKFTTNDEATEIKIQPRTKKTVEIFLRKKCIISWQLRIVEWGVKFTAEFVPDCKSSYTIILHKEKKMVHTDEALLSYYKFKVAEPGKIVMIVDNPTLKGKRFVYRFKIRPVQD